MFIRLNGIQIFAHHGVYEEEIRNGNNFEIDLEVQISDPAAAISDELVDALDYTRLYKIVSEVSESRRYNLLETFASDICKKVLDLFLEVNFVQVKLRKLAPPIGGNLKNVEIELQMKR